MVIDLLINGCLYLFGVSSIFFVGFDLTKCVRLPCLNKGVRDVHILTVNEGWCIEVVSYRKTPDKEPIGQA